MAYIGAAKARQRRVETVDGNGVEAVDLREHGNLPQTLDEPAMVVRYGKERY